MEPITHRRRLSAVLLLLIIGVASSVGPVSVAAGDGEKVKLALYYEALCPSCTNFIVNYLYKVFDNGLIDIVDLELSPYGNAKIRSNGTIVCQHGPWECVLNTIEACAIHVWPDLIDYFPFIYCVENLIYKGKHTEWETCFAKVNKDPKPVTDCYSSGYGKKLELQYAAATNALEPPHTYVPWVTVDGQPLYDDYRYFISFICKAYKGTNVPQACNGLSLNRVSGQKERVNSVNPVCYREEETQSLLSKVSSAVTLWMHSLDMANLHED